MRKCHCDFFFVMVSTLHSCIDKINMQDQKACRENIKAITYTVADPGGFQMLHLKSSCSGSVCKLFLHSAIKFYIKWVWLKLKPPPRAYKDIICH